MIFSQDIFTISTDDQFNHLALEAFAFQMKHNQVYNRFVRSLGVPLSGINHYTCIPFLPISFFKTQEIYASGKKPEITFRSSGTTGIQRSHHPVAELDLYKDSLINAFTRFYGNPSGYTIYALTPGPEQCPDSSLIYMIDQWIKAGSQPSSGFYLDNPAKLSELLLETIPKTDARRSAFRRREPGAMSHEPRAMSHEPGVLIIGLTYALLDFAGLYTIPLPGAIVMETGGMKGQRKEMVREEVHRILSDAFKVNAIHSEYSMSEILSQAFSQGDGIFFTPPWMKVLIRDANDPLSWVGDERTGGISIIDLVNVHSCPFIATQDLGKTYPNGSFEVLGRFDHSDLRGCNLMIG